VMAFGAGWLVMIVAGFVGLRGMQAIDYVGHLSVTMFAGALVLLPAACLTLVLPLGVAMVVDGLALLIAFALMFAMQKRRVAVLGLGSAWLWAWAFFLLDSTIGVVGLIASHFRA
jgi:hypothetical protein